MMNRSIRNVLGQCSNLASSKFHVNVALENKEQYENNWVCGAGNVRQSTECNCTKAVVAGACYVGFA